MRNHTYTTSNNERMDVSFLNYFSTISLSLMCYAFFNPKFVFELSMFLAYGIVNTTVTSYNIYNTYIYTPFKKHIKKPLMNILHIDDGLYEVEIVKNGCVIYRFKKMSDFVKNNPIKFVQGDIEDDDDEDDDSVNENETSSSNDDTPETETESKLDSSIKIETPVDADLTHESTDIHKPNSNSDEKHDHEDGESSDSSDSSDDSNEFDDGLILDPSEYDFVLRNIYFEDNILDNPVGFCLKYETFRQSDMKPKEYTYEEVKTMVSKRRFIGIHLKTEGKDYIINLSTPINYHIVNNTILDYSFLKMYMLRRYNVILGNTYKLSCIDNFIEMYTVEQGNKFLIKNNVFTIVDDETYNIDEEEGEEESEEEGEEEGEGEEEDEEEDEEEGEEEGKEEALTEADIEIVDCNYGNNN